MSWSSSIRRDLPSAAALCLCPTNVAVGWCCRQQRQHMSRTMAALRLFRSLRPAPGYQCLRNANDVLQAERLVDEGIADADVVAKAIGTPAGIDNRHLRIQRLGADCHGIAVSRPGHGDVGHDQIK